MTAESVVLVILLAATLVCAAFAALILAAFDTAGWAVIAALAALGLLVWRLVADHLAKRAYPAADDLADEWHAS